MLPEEGPERPKAVTIIGRVWLVVAVLSLCRVLVNLTVWKVLHRKLRACSEASSRSRRSTGFCARCSST
jgi:hypothetical protein